MDQIVVETSFCPVEQARTGLKAGMANLSGEDLGHFNEFMKEQPGVLASFILLV